MQPEEPIHGPSDIGGADAPTDRHLPDPGLPGVFLALSGGGAKGLGHIGVIRAIQDADLKVLGFAGTSAGALVAALAAAGYDGAELIDVPGNRTIFDTRPSLSGMRPIDLISGWNRLARLRELAVLIFTES